MASAACHHIRRPMLRFRGIRRLLGYEHIAPDTFHSLFPDQASRLRSIVESVGPMDMGQIMAFLGYTGPIEEHVTAFWVGVGSVTAQHGNSDSDTSRQELAMWLCTFGNVPSADVAQHLGATRPVQRARALACDAWFSLAASLYQLLV